MNQLKMLELRVRSNYIWEWGLACPAWKTFRYSRIGLEKIWASCCSLQHFTFRTNKLRTFPTVGSCVAGSRVVTGLVLYRNYLLAISTTYSSNGSLACTWFGMLLALPRCASDQVGGACASGLVTVAGCSLVAMSLKVLMMANTQGLHGCGISCDYEIHSLFWKLVLHILPWE
jgi:hypothetical protein